jgi:hypothetical protein
MVIAGVLEFFSGNTFPFVVSCGFGKWPTLRTHPSTSELNSIPDKNTGGFWLTMGASLAPGFCSFAAYSSDPLGNPYQGLTEPGFLASFGQ